MRSVLLLCLLAQVFALELPGRFQSADDAEKWAKLNIGEKLKNKKVKSLLTEAIVMWVDSDMSGKSIQALTICRKINSNSWDFVRLETFEDIKYDGVNYDNFGKIDYDADSDYLGYFTKNKGILIQGLAIDEASGAIPPR